MQIALILLALLAMPAAAADAPAARLIKDVEGVYQHSFNAGRAGQTFKAEDTVELLRRADNTLYVHAALTTPDGQRCTISGVASHEKGAFVYRDPNPPLSGDQCTLTVALAGDTLRLSDRIVPKGASTCRALCSARSSLGDYAIPMSAREKIGNTARLKASREYAKAVKDFEEAQR